MTSNGNLPAAPLFSATLISPEVQSALPEGYKVRPLQKSDYHAGFLDVLRVLTQVGDISEERWAERYEWMANMGAPAPSLSSPAPTSPGAASPTGPSDAKQFTRKSSGHGSYFVIVIINETDKIVGTGTLVVERKFIHDLGIVGHIEDIAVAKDQQGKKLGLRIINALDYIASESILDCSEANEGFYKKCGFKRAGLEMAHYYEQKPSDGAGAA
ncbi:MAG: Glucosamine-phosphate N-acetyltransferase-like protein [Bathelium mastoideum]|nr:MAG: Glucosamine-phosphate N-acetyltransferase-like protein [Bathelium mastoideum]